MLSPKARLDCLAIRGRSCAGEPWADDPLTLVNLPVWESAEALKNYAYRSAHATLWWVPAGHTPSLAEAHERLETYRRDGATARAFWFSRIFPAPEE